jgi:hypothetical protein
MEYQLIPIPGNGNCLFRSVSHLIFGTQEEHRNIRLRVVNLVVNNWDVYKEFVIGDLSYRPPIYNSNDYEQLMSLDGEYAGHVELKCISRLYSNHTFRVYRSNDFNEFVDYGSSVTMCNN